MKKWNDETLLRELRHYGAELAGRELAIRAGVDVCSGWDVGKFYVAMGRLVASGRVAERRDADEDGVLALYTITEEAPK